MPNIFLLGALLFLLSTIFVFLVIKNKIGAQPKKSKKFLLLTGASSIGFFVFGLLHNLTSALLSELLHAEIEEPVFFLLAVFVSPIAFLIGAIGSVVCFIKDRAQNHNTIS